VKLYGSLTSPYVRKVRMLIIEKKITCEFATADAWGPDSPIPKLNPLGKVPVLERDVGDTLFDSPVIAEYLDSLTPPAFIPPAGPVRWDTLRWQALADGMMDATVSRLLESRRPAAQQSADNVKRQEAKVIAGIAYAEAKLSGGPYLTENKFSFSDISLAVALGYVDFRFAHDWRGQHPRLAAWFAGIAVRESFRQTAPPAV
jgi:glutathione S-transferase